MKYILGPIVLVLGAAIYIAGFVIIGILAGVDAWFGHEPVVDDPRWDWDR